MEAAERGSEEDESIMHPLGRAILCRRYVQANASGTNKEKKQGEQPFHYCDNRDDSLDIIVRICGVFWSLTLRDENAMLTHLPNPANPTDLYPVYTQFSQNKSRMIRIGLDGSKAITGFGYLCYVRKTGYSCAHAYLILHVGTPPLLWRVVRTK